MNIFRGHCLIYIVGFVYVKLRYLCQCDAPCPCSGPRPCGDRCAVHDCPVIGDRDRNDASASSGCSSACPAWLLKLCYCSHRNACKGVVWHARDGVMAARDSAMDRIKAAADDMKQSLKEAQESAMEKANNVSSSAVDSTRVAAEDLKENMEESKEKTIKKAKEE